ncbi:hypothetical protein [Paractinoplanes hotanensis]|uniref:Uncharacterized protein n=1 Tax=Paractinoplanes hotanensis TaxID=2906497 RepID=A0ABT0Y4Y9_9ACTN|nr:hypothetical protein [Actinoplanes hotanensis]MCM4081096.1 hypothetical protein [Actinoplanes hotanensis]
MSYVGIDTQGARILGQALRDVAARTEDTRKQTVTALGLAELTGRSPANLALLQESLHRLGTGVTEKADLADRFTVAPQQTAATMGATAGDLGPAIAGLIGLSGPRSLRDVLVGLPPPGANAALDGALARLSPLLLQPRPVGEQPKLPEPPPAELMADLRLLALQLGIEHVGPPAPEKAERAKGLFAKLVSKAVVGGDSEVFYDDFWADGRTIADVLADPAKLLAWVSGTVELDRRLALAAGRPTLGDALDSYDFARGSENAADETAFAAISDYLPQLLAGRTDAAPDPIQLAQTLAFAARVGWTDPGGADAERFTAAVAYLRANRILQSALLPVGFAGDTEPLAFFNAPGIAATLELGRSSGVVDSQYLSGLAALLDQVAPAIGLNLTGGPVELTESIQQQLFALVASQIPRAMAGSPAIQAQFIASLGHLRQAATGAELRQRILDVVAAFRTIAVVGAPALTERRLTTIVGDQVLGVLGRSRLRLRSESAVRKNPEFLLVARQFGIPGSRKEEIGKYKFSFGFDELGVLTGIRRKKKSWLSRAWDSIKAVGKAILESWKDNPFKAIFQVGKIALGVLSFAVPGLQGLGAAALALSIGETAYHAIEGDWLAAIGSGLSALTAGADIFGTVGKTALDAMQGDVLSSLFDNSTLEMLRNAKRAFDIGTSVLRFTEADGLLARLTAGLGAGAIALGSGGQLLGSIGAIEGQLAQDLIRLGTSVGDLSRVAAPALGLVEAIRKGDLLAAFSTGLSALSAGAVAVVNPKGIVNGPPGTALFSFDAQSRDALIALAKGSGIAAALAKAINAADTGNAFAAGAALAEALKLTGVTRPQPPVDPQEPAPGDPAEIAKRIAEVGVVLEAVFKGANPALAAPVVLRQLGLVVDALNPAPPPKAEPVAGGGPVSAPAPVPGGSPVLTPVPGGSPVLTPVPGIVIGGAEPISVLVAAESATLPGGSGGDEIAGGSGDDEIAGGAGEDTLTVFGGETTSGSGLLNDVEVRTTPFLGLWLPEPDMQLDKYFPQASELPQAFTPNAILDGGSATSEKFLGLIGWGTSVTGPHEASHSFYIGELGFGTADNDGGAVDGLTLNAQYGLGAQIGSYGAAYQYNRDVNLAPLLDLEMPTVIDDTMLGVNLPHIGAVGFRQTNDEIRPLEPQDFQDTLGAGTSFGVGFKWPLWGDYEVNQIAAMAGVQPGDVLLARETPAGTQLAFDVADDFSKPFVPPFGTTLDLGDPGSLPEPALGGGFGGSVLADPVIPAENSDFHGGGGDFGGGGASGEIPLVPDGIVLDYDSGFEFGYDTFDSSNLTDYGFADDDFGDYSFDDVTIVDSYDFGGAVGSDLGFTDLGFSVF